MTPVKLTVRLFAVLRERAGTERLLLEDVPEPLAVGGLKRLLRNWLLRRRSPAKYYDGLAWLYGGP